MGKEINKTLILNRIKEAYGLSGNSELARFFGVAPNTVTNWYDRGTLNVDVVFPKCEDLNLNWMIYGEGEMFKNKGITTGIASEPITEYKRTNEYTNELLKEINELRKDKERLINEKLNLQEIVDAFLSGNLELIKKQTKNKA